MIGAIIAKKKAKAGFAAFASRDIDLFIASWAEDATFIYPGNLPVSGTYQGKPEIKKWFDRYLEQFPRFSFTLKNICVKNIIGLSGSNVVSVEWDYTGENKNGKTVNNSGVTAIEIKGMKAIRVQDYMFDLDALKRAWEE
jgi:ketosteroid isomerase-like protein